MEMLTFKQFFSEKHCWKGYTKRGMKKKGDRLVNNCVKIKEDVNDRPIIGLLEPITIDGIGEIDAKVDSGNEAFNVLHGTDVKIDGDNVTFNCVNDQQISKPLNDTIVIHIGSGVKEERPVVLFDIVLQGKTYQAVPFSIADRSENEEPVLVGEPFIKSINALIDVKEEEEATSSY